ncbi:MAG: hypothetical protein HYU85_01745 [Chloroflexi bacterium]|nr:hypothetical protein [Chloroflexota bacterium]
MKGKTFLVIGILVILSMVFGISSGFAMGNSKGSIEEAREKLEERVIGVPGIAGITHSEEEIMVFLENEGAGKDVPDRFMGFPVQKKVTGKFKALGLAQAEAVATGVVATRTGVVRPLVGGISLSAYIEKTNRKGITTVTKYAGTLGMITYGDNKKILSNAHVIAMDPSTAEFLPKGTTPVVQPGTYDDGTLANRVGALENYIPIIFSKSVANPTYNYADAATGSLEVDGTSGAQFGDYIVSGTTVVSLGDTVRKSGRTTGVTENTVSATNATVWVWYTEKKKALFGDQILVDQPFIKSGDSGSAVDKAGAFVGLAFAGSDTSAVVCKASYIIDGLGILVQ